MKTGFIGGGKMAAAMISDMVKSETVAASNLFVCDISEERRTFIKEKHGVNVVSDNKQIAENCDIIFLAVKPQNQDEILTEIAPSVTDRHLIISIAAGRLIQSLENLLPQTRVIRVMPNLPAVVSEGMSVFCRGQLATDADRTATAKLLSCFGKVIEMPENKFDAVTALSGSGPAFFAYLPALMIEAAENLGLERSEAALLAKQTMLGTAKLLINEDLDPNDLIDSVSSAKGTTVAGMDVLKASPLKQIISDTLAAAANRSKELSK
jgi:pyrroline-5-carboxylate reductase